MLLSGHSFTFLQLQSFSMLLSLVDSSDLVSLNTRLRETKYVLRETKSEESTNDNNIEKLCNCRNVNECPLNNMCLTKDLVYQAEVKTKDNNDIKTYIGMTATTFKERYRNHKKAFNDIKYENETELSKHVWKLKLNREQFNIKWSILSRASSIKAGGNS